MIQNIKNITISAALFMGLADFVVSQTYNITPNDTIQMNGTFDHLETLSIQLNNQTSDSISFKWSKVSEVVPSNWESAICDNSFCYPNLAQSGTMNTISGNEYGLLVLHITPHFNEGMAIIRYAVWDESTPLSIDTLTYILQVSSNTNLSDANLHSEIIIYPNPAQDFIYIKSDLKSKIEYFISDLTGKVLKQGTFYSNQSIVNTNELPSGMYTITLIENQIFKKSYPIIIKAH